MEDDIDNMDFELPSELTGPSAVPQQAPLPFDQEVLKQWTCVYPVYLDAAKSTAQGRKVPSAFAVKDPAVVYMGEAVRRLGLVGVLESDKRHPRDAFTFGRIRVQMKHSNGQLMNPAIKSKKMLLIKLAQLVPAVKEEMDKSDPRFAVAASSSRSELLKVVEQMSNVALKEAGPSSSKKKGKKGRK